MNHEETNVVPVNQPPNDRYAVGNSNIPDQPMNTNLSLFNQSSINDITPAK